MNEQDIQRFGVSIGSGLLEKFDDMITEKGYTNRSEAIRDLIRNKLVETEWGKSTDAHASIGTITIVYDHHTREIGDRLTDLAHDHHNLVMSSMNVHLTHKSRLEGMLVKGCGKEIRAFSDRVISIRGVKHGKLVITGLVDDESEKS